ncbi:peptide deformylase [Chromatiales bacterium (ex Bugula neritina AB1)]|nr:peptide deformylase [Chromatiales bacterium (ex Bugula neritina AB1)]
MAILDILLYPDERLRTVAKPVDTVDKDLQKFLDDMFETMYKAPGIGLAATQVNMHKRAVVIDVSEDKNEPLVLINPEILTKEGKITGEEGCLSIPGIYDNVSRAERITFQALDRDGNPYEMEADGLLGVCVQHEVDHLDGKMFVDYLSAMKRRKINKKIQKNTLRTSN